MENFTTLELFKLKEHLIKNAAELANSNKIEQIPYYRNNQEMKDYQWTKVAVKENLVIEMYFTSVSHIVKINGVFVQNSELREIKFEDANDVLVEELKRIKIKETKGLLGDL